jgi:type I restriction enzyme S subunit
VTVAWRPVQLGSLLKKAEEVVWPVADARYTEVTVRLWGRGVVPRGVVDGLQLVGQRRFRARSGQFIASRIDARNGALGVVPASLDGAIVTNDFPLFDVDPARLDPEFLGWLSRTESFVDLCRRASEGTTNRVRLKEERFLALEIALPPADEQRRILSRIEAIAGKVEEARRLRGKADEEAEALLPAVYSKLYEHASRLGPVNRLDELCVKITDGTHSTPHYIDSGIPFLSVKDITTGMIDFGNCRHISPEEHGELTKRCNPERGDVLLTKVGTTGFAKTIDTDREFSIFVSLALLKLRRDRLCPEFAEYMLNSSRLQEHSAAGTRGVGNKNLVLKFIREFPMPTPTLNQQKDIVEALNDIRSTATVLSHQRSSSASGLEAFLPAVLDKAFRGEM